jgi:hypothetical protein
MEVTERKIEKFSSMENIIISDNRFNEIYPISKKSSISMGTER